GSCAERPFLSTRSLTPLKPTGVSFTDGIHLMPFRAPIGTSPSLLSSNPRQQRLWRSPRSTGPLRRDPNFRGLALTMMDSVAILDLPVQRKTVSEPGASTAGHVHPEVRVLRGPQRLTRLRVVPLDELLDLVRSRFCERDLNHRHSPCLAKTITPLFNPLRTVFATLNRPQEVHFSGFPMYRRSARKPRLSYTWRARS